MTIDRLRVIASSAVTWLTLAAVIAQQVVAEVANAGLDDGITETIVSFGGRAAAFLIGVVAVIRRVSPVDEDARGLL